MLRQEIPRSGRRRLQGVFRARCSPRPPMPHCRGAGSRSATAGGCDPNRDAGFQPKLWPSPRVAEAGGAGNQRALQTPAGLLPGPGAAAQRRRRAGAVAPKQGHRGWRQSPARWQADPNLPSTFGADPPPLRQDERKRSLINRGTAARGDRWQKHPAMSRVYPPSAAEGRNQSGGVGYQPHARTPAQLPPPAPWGKAGSSQEAPGRAAPGRRSGCAGARRLRAPPREAPAPQGCSSLAAAGSLRLCQPPVEPAPGAVRPCPGRRPAAAWEQRRAVRVWVLWWRWALFPQSHPPLRWGPQSPGCHRLVTRRCAAGWKTLKTPLPGRKRPLWRGTEAPHPPQGAGPSPEPELRVHPHHPPPERGLRLAAGSGSSCPRAVTAPPWPCSDLWRGPCLSRRRASGRTVPLSRCTAGTR